MAKYECYFCKHKGVKATHFITIGFGKNDGEEPACSDCAKKARHSGYLVRKIDG